MLLLETVEKLTPIENHCLTALASWLSDFLEIPICPKVPTPKRVAAHIITHVALLGIWEAKTSGDLPSPERWVKLTFPAAQILPWLETSLAIVLECAGARAEQWNVSPEEMPRNLGWDDGVLTLVKTLLMPALHAGQIVEHVVSRLSREQIAAQRLN